VRTFFGDGDALFVTNHAACYFPGYFITVAFLSMTCSIPHIFSNIFYYIAVLSKIVRLNLLSSG